MQGSGIVDLGRLSYNNALNELTSDVSLACNGKRYELPFDASWAAGKALIEPPFGVR